MNNLTLGSLFDGIGGFPYAASFYGIKTLWASEVLPAAISVTRRHFPSMVHVGDISGLNGGTLAPVNIITFGSPCQGLSSAGARRGLADERSGLFVEAIRIINEMREATNGQYPRYGIWENVPGAFSTSGGSDYKAVLEAFTAAGIPMPESGKWAKAGMVRSGSVDIAWCVYNAQYFGVAQRRRRIFLVADFAGRSAGKILFIPKSLRRYYQAGGTPRQGAAAYAENGTGAADKTPSPNNCLNGWDNQQCRTFPEDGQAPTLAGADGGGGRNPGGLVCAAFMGGQSATSGSIAYNERVSPTLRGSVGSNTVPYICEPELARTLTARGDSSPCVDRGQNMVAIKHVLCAATGQANAEIVKNRSATITAGHEQPYIVHKNAAVNPDVSGTICASGAGLSRTAGMASEADLCVVQEVLPIHDRATRCKGGGNSRNDDGSGNGLGIGKEGDAAPTITARDRHAVAVDCRNHKESGHISGTLQSKSNCGYSLNYQNPVRCGYIVRRLTPTEAERLQGYPDGWTEYGHDNIHISDSRRYQLLGNSIAVPCVAYIFEGIIQEHDKEVS